MTSYAPLIQKNQVLALIPARGGSKSIPLKNIIPLSGVPLLSYVAATIKSCKAHIDLALCSTDHPEISNISKQHHIEVDTRPAHLCGDDIAVKDVIKELLIRLGKRTNSIPEMVLLFQPTNPFVLPEHVTSLIEKMKASPHSMSGQTVTEIEHNLHAFNQRIIKDEKTEFYFHELRQKAFNKQAKPKMYRFGNLVATRSTAILDGKDCFATPSVAIEIPRYYAMDVDTKDDLAFAEFLRTQKIIKLPKTIEEKLQHAA